MLHLATRWLPIIRQMAATNDGIRFAALIGSYARKDTPADPWSDLDLVISSDDPDQMFSDTSWLSAFGEPKIVFTQGLPVSAGRECRALFADGSMLDVVIFVAKEFSEVLYSNDVLQIFRRGYQIVCDKDGLTDSSRFDPEQPIPEEGNTLRYRTVWKESKIRNGGSWRIWHVSAMCLELLIPI